MGWERLLTDAVYHNNLDEVKKYLSKDDVRRAIGRREWAEATQKVEELVEEEKAAVREVKEREHLATRVRLAAAGRVQELAAHAKAVTKKRDPAKRFVPCGCCLLTPFDTKVEWRVCEGCGTRCHLMCQLESLVTEDQALPAALPFTCRVCHSTATFPHLSRQVEAEVEELKAKVVEASRQLAAAQVELAAKRGEVTEERGEHRRHLDEVLERIGATRQRPGRRAPRAPHRPPNGSPTRASHSAATPLLRLCKASSCRQRGQS